MSSNLHGPFIARGATESFCSLIQTGERLKEWLNCWPAKLEVIVLERFITSSGQEIWRQIDLKEYSELTQ